MRIQHNIMAMNAYRNYTNNTSAVAKNLEKLSSGYRINRAGDDAAGLAISEKMRAQITGLSAAQKNVKDGISLVKTAEGATQEVHDMLNRMVYLAEQSANGTYQDEVDREAITNEFEALKSEINRIADSSNFNGIKLLDGSLSDRKASEAKITTVGTDSIKGYDRILKDVSTNFTDIGSKTLLDVADKDEQAGSFSIDLNKLNLGVDGSSFDGTEVTKAGFQFKLTIDGMVFDGVKDLASTAINATYAISTGGTITATNVTAENAAKDFAAAYSAGVTINGMKWNVDESGGVLTFTQQNAPTTKDGEKLNFDVTVNTLDTDGAGNGSSTIRGNINAGTHPETEAVMAAKGQKANTVFKITEKDITDGSTITVGDKTVTLKVGAKSSTDAGAGTVDLSGMEEGDIDLDAALTAIAAKFNELGDATSTQKDAAGNTGTLKVGVTNDGNGHAVGLGVHRNDDGATVIYSTVDELAKEFSMERNKNVVQKAVEAGKGLTLQIGDTSDDYNKLTVAIDDMHTYSLGLDKLDLGTQEGAQAAVATIKDAINKVSQTRGTLGATQNRLEHTANNLSTMKENIQDAESTIRDTDIAEEMMAYTKNNILVQSAQAMLAQANQVPQGVLQLLG